jgi:rSAM/selenodomain-associated transferase 2
LATGAESEVRQMPPAFAKVGLSVSNQVSVLIPTCNEAERIEATVKRCLQDSGIEVFVIDGGSSDDTVNLARRAGARVFQTKRRRACQMDYGAAQASGDILIFLHADTLLPLDFADHVVATLNRPGVIGGAFRLHIRADSLSLRLIEIGVNWRSRFLGLPYGDQAIFMKAETFHNLGGYGDLEIMEDFDLVRRLKRLGRINLAQAHVSTSARRWEELGPWRATLINQIAVTAYYLGVAPARIAKFYYRDRT